MKLRQVIFFVTLGVTRMSLTSAHPSTIVQSLNPSYEAMEKESSAHLLARSTSMKTALQSHLGIKFWKYIYGEGPDKKGRELTADNCAACAAEENLERVQDLKQREDGFKFVNNLITTLFSPISNLLKGNSGGAGKTKHGKEPMTPEVRFRNLAILMAASQENQLENGRPYSAAFLLLQTPYIEEMGELGKSACKETPSLKFLKSEKVLENFCSDQAQSIKLLDSLDTFLAKME